MRRTHLLLAILTTWLLAFSHIGVLAEPTDAASLASVYAAVVAVVVLSRPTRRSANLALVLPSTLLIYLPLRQLSGYPVPETPLGYIAGELAFVAVAVVLATLVSQSGKRDDEPQIAVQPYDPAAADSVARTILYREIRRARNYERPLSLLAIEVEDSSIDRYVERMLTKFRRSDAKEKIISNVVDTLAVALEDYITLAREGDRLIIALPEVRSSQLPPVIDRIRRVVAANVGVNLEIGRASLHEDGMVLDVLMQKAIKSIHSVSEPASDSDETRERLPRVPPFPERRIPFTHETPIQPGEVIDGFGDHQPS